MSESREDGCYCKKCGVPVNPTDEKCQNGHILKEVGRHFVRSAEAKIGVSAEVKTELTKAEKNFLQKIGIRIRKSMKSMGADSVTIKLPGLEITFNERE